MLLYVAIGGRYMKRWVKIHISDKNRQVDLISRAFTNYLYSFGPINEIKRKYHISDEDKKAIDQYSANRIAGILMLYLSKDYQRINDIANKYNVDYVKLDDIIPEVEGYIEK